jgi:hypothetical protein
MRASGGPWAADRPYIIKPQRHNGQPHLNIYLERITVTERSGALSGSIAQWLFLA